ncbi:MAG: polysaccharide deacetylase family protein [Oscillospiraceae bacterium]|nr:polysaccharide deacetylase family protein [Oscillospiraceae bacterium]
MKRVFKVLAVALALVFVAAGIIYASYSLNLKKVEAPADESLKPLYSGDIDVSNALEKLKNGYEGKAEILGGVNSVETVVAITFEGMLDKESAQKITALLDAYNAPATFFFPAIKSAEEPDGVKTVFDAGYEVGNYTLSAKENMQELSSEELVKDFSRAGSILKQITGVNPYILKCNRAEYTDELLNAAGASGINYALDSTYFLNEKSFRSKENAQSFVRSIKSGAIISFKTDSALSENEFKKNRDNIRTKLSHASQDYINYMSRFGNIYSETFTSTQSVSSQNISTESSLNEASSSQSVSEESKSLSLVENVELLLAALKEQGYKVVSPNALEAYSDEDFSLSFTQKRSENKGMLAEVYKRVLTDSPYVAYSFRGIENGETLDKVLEVLKKNNIKATFFVTGHDILMYPDRIEKIIKAGHYIGNGGLTGKSMEKMDFKEACFEIYKCGKLLNEKFGVSTSFFMPVYGKYSDVVLEAASALGYSVVTYNVLPVKDSTSSVDEIMKYLDAGIKNGDIINFRLDLSNDLDKVVSQSTEKIQKLGKSIVGLEELKNSAYYSLENENSNQKEKASKDSVIVNGIKISTKAGDYDKLLLKNSSQKANEVKSVYTTMPAVSYVFRGISDRETLDAVLDTLDRLGAKATFFVTGKELIKYPENAKAILNRGHQICNGGYGMNYENPAVMNAKDICYEIDMGEKCLKAFLGDRYNESVDKLYMPLYAESSDSVLEAAKAMGYDNVVSYSKNTVLSEYKNMTADEIISKYYANTVCLEMGEVVFFRLDFLTQKNAVNDLVSKVSEKYVKNVPYKIITIGDMLSSPLVYNPLSKQEAEKQSLIKDHGYTEIQLDSKIYSNYIGNPSINDKNTLEGFTDEEISKIDKTGKVDTKGEKVLFLTFDDWGHDTDIIPLLNVLKKYNVKGTFFVRVGTASTPLDMPFSNPNLLRKIALDGHDIGSHTFTHMTVDINDEDEKAKLEADVKAAYDEMYRYIGDTGRLTLYFRPPTLAVSKLGMETIFNFGHSYIVNGDFSTHDYEAKNKQELVDKLLNGFDIFTEAPADLSTPSDKVRRISSGSIIVMHMSENARYTAEALDTVIPFYMNLGYRFARLSDYLEN